MESNSPIRVVVLEDDEPFLRLVTRMLESAGFTVTGVGASPVALKIIASSERIDLLLTDIGMPAGTPHGFSIGNVAQLRRPGLKVLYMSASDLGGFAMFRDQPVLRKPFTAEELLAAVDTVLR